MTNSRPKSAFSAAAKIRSVPKKRPPPFSIRFSDEERAQLDYERGVLSLAAYIRLKLFTDPANQRRERKKLSRRHFQPSAELSMIGAMLGGLGKSRLAANMNQIAKAANSGALPVSPELEQELSEACADIRAMRCQLVEAMGVADKQAS